MSASSTGRSLKGIVTMREFKNIVALALATTALLGVSASAQETPQASPPGNAQMGTCPMMQGQPMNGNRMPGMGTGKMGGAMGNMAPEGMQDMQQMHTEMAALREEMRLLREELGRRR
jgi:hypothetical protein